MTGGYTLAMNMIGEGERRSLLPDHLGLSEFVAVHYGEKLSGYSWCSPILKHERDDGTALNTFFVLLDEYLISLGYEPIPKPEV